MLHIYYNNGGKVACMHAVRSFLDLKMGVVKDMIESGKPLYSFEADDVDVELVREMVGFSDFSNVGVRFTEELNGEEEVITKEMFLNLLDSGQLIARQVEEDIEREADEG